MIFVHNAEREGYIRGLSNYELKAWSTIPHVIVTSISIAYTVLTKFTITEIPAYRKVAATKKYYLINICNTS